MKKNTWNALLAVKRFGLVDLYYKDWTSPELHYPHLLLDFASVVSVIVASIAVNEYWNLSERKGQRLTALVTHIL